MPTAGEMLNQNRNQELWQRYCGFVNLSLEDFMNVQVRLLMEQLEMLSRCELGKHLMGGNQPRSINEFRETVPLTTYADYAPFLLTKNENCLPEKPVIWIHTSGASGIYPHKWIPITERWYEEVGAMCMAMLIFATCRERGDINLKANDRYLYALAPPPYLSGAWARRIAEELPDAVFLPPLDEAEKMSFGERTQQGFALAMSDGMDIFGGISSVLVAIGERFAQGERKTSILPLLRKPKMMARMIRGVIRAKMARRRLLPKDLWTLKGILVGGTDTLIYREKIKEMWGIYPLDAYACCEAGTIAIQTWDHKDMTFLPNFDFFEFIPEQESYKSKHDPTYKPKTVLLDEVKAGSNYEMVITNFLGGAMVRYRVGDMIRITSLSNNDLNIRIPQMIFFSRADNIIDIAGFTRLTEKIIWQAIANSGVAYQDWIVRKEADEKPYLHLYLEPKANASIISVEEITLNIHQKLSDLDMDYANLESMLGIRPLRVTLLPAGAFQKYIAKQQAAGVDLAHIKPPHVNASDVTLDYLKNHNGTS